VVGNPANTNCLIASHFAPSIPKKNFSALSRLDQNRAKSILAQTATCRTAELKKLAIWGNHSSTMFPDVSNLLVGQDSFYTRVPDFNEAAFIE
jgi:malate dehydrogenase